MRKTIGWIVMIGACVAIWGVTGIDPISWRGLGLMAAFSAYLVGDKLAGEAA